MSQESSARDHYHPARWSETDHLPPPRQTGWPVHPPLNTSTHPTHLHINRAHPLANLLCSYTRDMSHFCHAPSVTSVTLLSRFCHACSVTCAKSLGFLSVTLLSRFCHAGTVTFVTLLSRLCHAVSVTCQTPLFFSILGVPFPTEYLLCRTRIPRAPLVRRRARGVARRCPVLKLPPTIAANTKSAPAGAPSAWSRRTKERAGARRAPGGAACKTNTLRPCSSRRYSQRPSLS